MLKKLRGIHIFLLFFGLLVICNILRADSSNDNETLYKGKGAKYVFLFIGDGLGPLQRIAAEKAFKAPGRDKLWMNTLPVEGAVNTLNYGGGITDSAAAATALSCGHKTRNGVLGLDHQGKSVESIAETAKKMGWKVGIVTSVQLNHATPAGFYAHRMKRGMYNEIIRDLAASNFDYFGGGNFMIKGKRREVLEPVQESGYIMIDSPKEMPKLDPDKKYIVHTEIPYEIDRTEDSGLTLADFTRLGLRHIYSGAGKTKGFFMMVEGGKIDWSGHANDGGGLIREVKAFDDAVKVALDFYREHPESTTIVVVADHETGGLNASLTGIKPGWTPARLKNQKHSYSVMNSKLHEFKKDKVPFEKVISSVKADYGIQNFSSSELKKLREAWDIFTGDKPPQRKIKLLYGSYNPFVLCLQHIFSNRCGLKWSTTSHSALAVPVTAIGVGADIFKGYYENTLIADKLDSIIRPAAEK